MSLFQERIGVSTSYVHDLEKNDLLPGLERTKQLARVFREVATEQGAADPDDDARQLLGARERTLFTERLDIPPVLAEVLISVRESLGDADIGPEFLDPIRALGRLDAQQRLALTGPMEHAIDLFRLLKPEQRSGLARTIERTAHAVDAIDDDERQLLIMRLVENLDNILEDAEAGELEEDARAELAQLSEPDPA